MIHTVPATANFARPPQNVAEGLGKEAIEISPLRFYCCYNAAAAVLTLIVLISAVSPTCGIHISYNTAVEPYMRDPHMIRTYNTAHGAGGCFALRIHKKTCRLGRPLVFLGGGGSVVPYC